jgi:hypothetical protein
MQNVSFQGTQETFIRKEAQAIKTFRPKLHDVIIQKLG